MAKVRLKMKTSNNDSFSNRYAEDISQSSSIDKKKQNESLEKELYHPIKPQNRKKFSQKHNYPHIKTYDLKLSEKQKNMVWKSQHLCNQEIRQSHSNKSPFRLHKLWNNKIKEAAESKYLKDRAEEFIRVVNQQKSKLRGRFFFLRQQEEEKKKIKEQIQSLEKTFIKYHYQQKRRREADAHIRLLNKRAQERQAKLAQSHLRESNSAQQSNHQKSTFYFHKQLQAQKSKKRIKQTTNRQQKTMSNDTSSRINHQLQQQTLNLVLEEQDLKDLEQVRKKLIQLNNLMNKQDKYKRAQYDRY